MSNDFDVMEYLGGFDDGSEIKGAKVPEDDMSWIAGELGVTNINVVFGLDSTVFIVRQQGSDDPFMVRVPKSKTIIIW